MQPADIARHSTEETPHTRFRLLLERCRGLPPIRMAVVHPCDAASLQGAMDACEAGLIEPVLVGPEARIRRAAEAIQRDLGHLEIIATPHSHASAAQAATLARDGRVAALMKGALHTDELMHAALEKTAGLRTERRASHAFAIDVPGYGHPLIVADAAVNILPDLETKRDICQNTILLAHALGIAERRVAVLAAVETVHCSMPATVDAAALSKMAERGQLVGAQVDGPLAMDNALSEAARREKGIVSPVAGRANILLVPSVEAGNILVKQLVLLADAIAAGIVLGMRVPIALTSRADDARARLASAAIALLLAHQPDAERLAALKAAVAETA
ncbi:bifunctional enoyl-CoA hydratase/phosphate acetyltransferase [Dyella sedimenti]|uniref:bifunctional enoyl-CoA hydratase/phosphate acetyltransferase n=1 Tax=Dyella sedimenti TaxID=2919947 RepID=UPI001FA94D69|nr:bifunctional enoyl-CoA hydratase/phosphate acetyltransferase [Dyella sedimenti]